MGQGRPSHSNVQAAATIERQPWHLNHAIIFSSHTKSSCLSLNSVCFSSFSVKCGSMLALTMLQQLNIELAGLLGGVLDVLSEVANTVISRVFRGRHPGDLGKS